MKRLRKVFEDSPIMLVILVAFAVGLLILLHRFLITSRRKEKPLKAISRILKAQGLEPSMIRLLQAQAIHETGNFTSRLFLEQNNVFGMKVPSIRKTLNIAPLTGGMGTGFSIFLGIDDSVKDMLLYLDHFNIPLDLADPFLYAQILKDKNYYEDPVEVYFKGLANGLRIVRG